MEMDGGGWEGGEEKRREEKLENEKEAGVVNFPLNCKNMQSSETMKYLAGIHAIQRLMTLTLDEPKVKDVF
ncbi:uncharacterized protein Dana_GF26906 [Drosophila ananassae]|uniref:Uncharacterized protein n=1 Tax=Drosophila ananassae TaxID=7217 RepID=A0A0N8P0K7_DROAN|nr:uncharacterized protein Dana_GF26906 [Drosophila ananassae]